MNPVETRSPFAVTSERTVEWILSRFARVPEEDRTMAATRVALAVLAIGCVDYFTGTRLSLVVFYLLAVALATAWLGRRGAVLTAVGSMAVRFGADLLATGSDLSQAWIWWNSVASLGVFLLVIWILDALMKFHRQLEQRVRERTAELERETRRRQEVQRELLELSANERSAMGRELHDQLGQHLVGTAMAAQVLAQRLQAQEGHAAQARRIAELLEQGVAQTRQLAHGLLLTHLAPERLVPEFEELAATLRQQHPGVVVEVKAEARGRLRDAGVAAQVFRIGQEAMRNAMRHSGGRLVSLKWEDEADGGLTLEVWDDGRGLPAAEERRGGMGLRIMRHRAEHLGANLQIESGAGGGTRMRCTLPPANVEP